MKFLHSTKRNGNVFIKANIKYSKKNSQFLERNWEPLVCLINKPIT
jgi:hypothetical protein